MSIKIFTISLFFILFTISCKPSHTYNALSIETTEIDEIWGYFTDPAASKECSPRQKTPSPTHFFIASYNHDQIESNKETLDDALICINTNKTVNIKSLNIKAHSFHTPTTASLKKEKPQHQETHFFSLCLFSPWRKKKNNNHDTFA